VPQTFGPYRLESLLGRGGMGEVHRAHDTEHNRTVALKLLAGHLATDAGFQERFRREAFVTASLTEPHVIPIHRYGEIDGQLFLDMRLVEGESLDARLARKGVLEPTEALAILDQIGSALDAAHQAHLVHRDVKPSNILLTGRPSNPFAYLVDFGIARTTSTLTGQALTQTGSTVGTFDYMAPERFQPGPATPAVDVYALACVFYECVTGRKPFAADSLPALIYAHLDSWPPPASSLNPRVPPALDRVLWHGMAKDPAQRPPTAGAFIDAATQALRTDTTPHPPADETVIGVPPPPEPPWHGTPSPPPRRRLPAAALAAIVAAVVVLAAVVVVLVGTLGGKDDPTAATTATGSDGVTGPSEQSAPPTDQGTAPDPDPVPPLVGDEYVDGTAQSCFDGILDACDRLFSPDSPD
jgi:serine/threonine-protein kinase